MPRHQRLEQGVAQGGINADRRDGDGAGPDGARPAADIERLRVDVEDLARVALQDPRWTWKLPPATSVGNNWALACCRRARLAKMASRAMPIVGFSRSASTSAVGKSIT